MHRALFIGLILLGLFGLLSCGGADSNDGSTETLFLDAAKQTAPAFAAAAANSKLVSWIRPTTPLIRNATTFGAGSPLYAAYNLMRDYEYPRDEGRIDMTNMYKVMFEAGNAYMRAVNECTVMSEQEVSSPFDFGLAETYDCAGNFRDQEPNYGSGCAIRESGGIKHALTGFKWAPTPTEQVSLGTLQGHIDTGTNDLLMHMVNLVTYPAGSAMGGETGSGFSVRSFISGNSTDHSFELKSVVTGTSADGSWTSLVGKGISRGAGNHFLFRVWVGSGDDTNMDGKYFCIEATADETALSEMDQNGSDTVDEACNAYQDRVDALANERFTRTDAPLTESDFTDSSIYLSIAG
ncbi:MAG: hypothetical protein V1798_05455 [Pseudomonadota bacterium]